VLERLTQQVLAWILPAITVIVALWGANRVFWTWKWSQLSHEVRSARVAHLRGRAGRLKKHRSNHG
jgi:hypothetical protein